MTDKYAKDGGNETVDDDRRSLARARSEDAKIAKLRGAGEHIARRLREDSRCFQVQAAVEAGLSERSYYEYLQGDDDACQLFQALVIPALYEQAKLAEEKAEQDIACVESGSGAWASWHRWKLEKRYRKIYGDLAQAPSKVEVTGKDGKPLSNLSVAELLELLEKTR